MLLWLIANTYCRMAGHTKRVDGDGYLYCHWCDQALHWRTNEGLGWLGHTYFPSQDA